MNTTAISTVAGLEVRQRIRSTRWKLTLAILFVLVSVLVLGSLFLAVAVADERYAEWSNYLFDLTLAIVIFLGLTAAPTLSAMSINGDRRDATLALVQATPITALELAIGKWLGAWIASLALIGVAAPYLIWGLFTSPATVLGCLLGIVATATLLACYCALGLGFSALTARPAASAMLTQAAVLFLLIGLPIAFGMTIPMVMSGHQVQRDVSTSYMSPPGECRLETREETFAHTDRTWWLLAPNPVLIVSDAVSVGLGSTGSRSGVSQMIAEGGSFARATPYIVDETCSEDRHAARDAEHAHQRAYIGHTWFIGLLVTIVLGALGLRVAVRRLRVPARRLPRGVRVA